jgi:hypothetical protein
MRNPEAGRFNYSIRIQEQIEVDTTRPPPLGPLSPHGGFHAAKRFENLFGREFAPNLCDGIDERGLSDRPHRFGEVHGGNF